MNYITYDEGVKLTLNWNYKKLLCVAFVEDDCDACDSFFELVCPELEEMDIEVRCINLRKNIIPFPPVAHQPHIGILKKIHHQCKRREFHLIK